MTCGHVFAARATACVHTAGRLGAGDRCPWHQPLVAKHEPWVGDLLRTVDATSSGDLEEFHLAGLRLPGAALAGRNLRGADLRDARLAGADLGKADLARALLRRCDLSGADLTGADLTGADLTGADLTGARLRGAVLRDAVLDATVLLGADLAGADLTGAKIRSFLWNRRTSLAEVVGFSTSASATAGDADDTHPFLDPVAASGHPAPRASLADPDPELDRTHVYSGVADEHPTALHVRTPHPTDIMHPPDLATIPHPRPPRHHRWAVLVGVLGLLLGAGAAVLLRPHTAASVPADTTGLEAALAAERAANAASVAAQAEHQRAGAAATADAVEARRLLGVARAERDQAREESAFRLADASRLADAADRAAVAEARLAAMQDEREALAKANARSERLGAILAAGAGQMLADQQRLLSERDASVVAVRTHQELAAEAGRLRQALAAAETERDRLAAVATTQAGDLQAAREAIGRYLAKVAASDLGEHLGDDAGRGELLPIVTDRPLSLGGDYLMTMRMDAAGTPGRYQVGLGLTIQRPEDAGHPDVTVILYDAQRRPLRRVGFGFLDGAPGTAVVGGRAEVACASVPAFARVVMAPGAPVVTRR
jgi:hypothetical protein